MSNSNADIRIEGLRKSFGGRDVLRDVNLEVPAGSIFGFLGLNGAGKTTLIRILLGLLQPDAGRCLMAGIDPLTQPIEARRRIGYMAENQVMYGWMRVNELIEWVALFYPAWDATLAEDLLQRMRLDPSQKVGALSKGQTSRLALLLALSHRPKLVILDDPTLGLDPIARRDLLRDMIGHLQDQGITVFFSSHLLYEIEPICDRVAILHEGRILRCAPVDELRENIKRLVFQSSQYIDTSKLPGLLDIQSYDGQLAVTVEDVDATRRALGPIHPLREVDLNLDEIFEAYVTGRREAPHAG
ncbi:MAG TPA: ABC transporter ATP-binding protein [Verrucomicrobiae bacterium]|nr:ABC transporter ATP-binding protein [Verrucomicrobiae bacterium]